MKAKDAIYFSICILLIVFAISYCAVPWFHIRLPRYYPTLREWKMTVEVGVPSMGWYSQTAFGLLLSIPASVLTFLLLFFGINLQLDDTSIWYKLAGGIAISAILLMLLFFGWHEWVLWVTSK